MSYWKILLMMGVAQLRQAGVSKKAEDDNNTGKDDAIGAIMVFAADIVEALVLNKVLPQIPKEYQAGQKLG